MSNILARVRKHPLVRLDAERIRTRAYFSAEADRSRDPVANWLDAEEEETRIFVRTFFVTAHDRAHPDLQKLVLEEHYESVFSWSVGPAAPPRPPPPLGTKAPRLCSICLRTRPAVKFKTDAHVIPEQLGTKALITWDECDTCNHRAGRDYETDLGNMLLADRAISGTPSKGGGTAKLKFSDEGAFVGGQARGERRVIGLKDGDATVASSLTGPNSFVLDMKTPRFRPRRVVKALAKMTWQALPIGLRPEAEFIRRYVNEEVDWPTAEFYRVATPGVSRVALGVWKRLASANEELPLFVTLVSTANTVLIWASPDASGAPQPALLPGFPRIQLPGSNPTVTKIIARGDESIVAPRAKYEFGFQSMGLAFTKDPMRVRVSVGAGEGVLSFDGELTTPTGEAGAESGNVTYEIRSADFVGVLRVDRKLGEAKLQVHYSFDVAPSPRADLPKTKALVESMIAGADVRIRWLDGDAREIVAAGGGQPGDFNLGLLADGLEVGRQLAVLRQALGVDIPFPKELADDDRRVLEILAAGIANGRVRERANGEQELSVTRDQAEGLLGALAPGHPIELSGINVLPWTLFGCTVDPGEARLVLEKVELLEAADEVKARARSMANDAFMTVTVRFASVRHEFVRFLPAEPDAPNV